jgi:hypothetical protein
MMMQSSRSPVTIQWFQVLGLAGVQAAISLLWVIYNLYLPQLLSQFGFPKELAVGLLVVENGLGIAIEPLMGSLSDRSRHWLGTRFPFIAVGVVLTAVLSVSLPAIAFFGTSAGVLRWVLPGAMIAWALAMMVFRSPVLSLLGQYAFQSKLPQAASLLTFVGAVVGAIGSFANQFILSLGAGVAFLVGSIVLLLAATVLRRMNAQTQPIADTPITAPSLAIRSAGLIFGTGVGITLGGTLVRSLFAAANSPPLPTNMLLVFTITHLITVIPMGIVASKVGNQRSMLVAIGAIAVSLVLFSIVYSNPFSLGLVLIWGIAWSAIANGIIPYALSLVPPAKAGLGIGLFFGGGSFAITSVGILIRQIGTLSSLTSILGAAIAFLLAGCFIALSPKVRKE